MAVYIDDTRTYYKGMYMSHMAADTLEELHAMAKAVGIEQHFQNKPHRPHYDICQSKIVIACRLGAKRIPRREMINHFKKLEKLQKEQVL